nr:PEP/pyruvate-binding domain-containing protein [uncultured Undibacterium sp.]
MIQPVLTMTSCFFDAPQALQAGATQVGGKAAQLAMLSRYGLPVPVSFVIPAAICHQLLPASIWEGAYQACSLNEAERDTALAEIRQRIIQQTLPNDFRIALIELLTAQGWQGQALAVRSSAPGEDGQQHSFAGIHHSELNVTGVAAIEVAILKVVASLWTLQACLYREKIGLAHTDAAMAVVLMPMLKSQMAGVIFTCDPRDGREDRLLISSVVGLAESLVAGTVDGEDIIVQRDWSCQEWEIAHRRSSISSHVIEAKSGGGLQRRELSKDECGQAILSDAQAITLAKLALDTANAFDYSKRFLDIEWVFDGIQFYLVQARPISARNIYNYPQIAQQGSIWTNGNTKEILPYPLKISELDVMQVAVNEMLGVAHKIVNVTPLEGGQRSAIFNGYAYLNASLIQWEIYDTFNFPPEEVNFILGGHQTCIQVAPRPWHSYGKVTLNMLRAIVRFPQYRRRGLREAAEVTKQSKAWREQDVSKLSEQELLNEILDRARNTYLTHTGLCIMQGASGTLMNLQKMLLKTFPDEGKTLVSAIMTEGEMSISAQQAYDLMQLAKLANSDLEAQRWLRSDAVPMSDEINVSNPFGIAYTQFLDNYGHRGNYESYISRSTWREQPETLKQAILNLSDVDTDALQTRQQQQAQWAWEQIKRQCAMPQRWLIKILQKQAKAECNQRELARSCFAMMWERCRILMLELGSRFAQRQVLDQADDIFHLNCAELQAIHLNEISGQAIKYRILDRKSKIAHWESLEIEDVIHEKSININSQNTASNNTLPSTKKVKLSHTDKRWQGIAVSMGSYQGRIKHISHPSQIGELRQGDIMLAPSSDPSWLPLFLKAGGVIVETGGYLSHSAIVARELAIPTVVNLPGIRTILKDGDEVFIDGPSGTVTRVKR